MARGSDATREVERVSKASFIVAFDGPGVEDGTIDVRDLAPALLALGQLVDAANRAVNGEGIPAKVQARAVSKGSFEVDLQVVLKGWGAIRDLLLSEDVDGAQQLIAWIGIAGSAGGSLFALLRFLKGRKPERLERRGSIIVLEIEDQTLVVPIEVLKLYREVAVNEAVQRLTRTLESGAIETIEFRDDVDGRVHTTITQEDRIVFVPPERPEPVLTDETRQMALSIRSLAFQEGNKWRLFDGQNVITATIEDEDFLRRIERNLIRFAKSDILVCEVRTVQTETRTGLRTEHTIIRVVDYRPAPSQIDLFL